MSYIARQTYLFGLMFPLWAGLAGAQAITIPISIYQGQTFGMVGLAMGQTARLNVLYPSPPAPYATAVMCPVDLAFIDDQGNQLKSASVTIIPGQSYAFDLNHDVDVKTPPLRLQIRATIRMTVGPPVLVAQPVVGIGCNVIPTLEIFDNATGKTTVLLDSTRYLLPSPLALTPTKP